MPDAHDELALGALLINKLLRMLAFVVCRAEVRRRAVQSTAEPVSLIQDNAKSLVSTLTKKKKGSFE